MEIKNKFLRLTNNKIIFCHIKSLNTKNDRSLNDIHFNDIYGGYITKIANTPQKLIQVGDLVEVKGVIHLVTDIKEDKYLLNNAYHIKKTSNIITKILTPNEDKSQYTLQWEQTK